MAVRHVRDEEIIARAILETRRGLRDAQRPTGTEKALTSEVAQDALERVGAVEQDRSDDAVEASLVPLPAGGLRVVSNVAAFTGAGPVATVGLAWDAVTSSTDGGPVAVVEYELWGAGGPLSRVPGAEATLSLPSGITGEYRVRPLSAHGVWGDLSDVLAVTGGAPVLAVRAPSTPTLTTGAGNAFARWDGTYTGGGTIGAHRVDVEARVGAAAWSVRGTLAGAGEQILKLGGIGDTIEVRFRAYDQMGRLTGTSVERTVTIAGITRPDFDAEFVADLEQAYNLAASATTAAAQAKATADGRNRRLGALTEPPATNPNGAIGDLWEQWGTDGKLKAAWRWEGATPAWVQKGLDPVYIPVIDIGTGTAGEFDAVRLKAGSVQADKLDVDQIWGSEAWLNVLNAGAIKVDFLEPNYGEKLNIWASEAVEIIVGRQDEQDHAVAEAQQSADTADGRAQAAEQGVAQAKAAAAIADGKALAADTKAQATQGQLAAHQAVFRVTSAGAEVTSKDGANVFAMTPAGAQIIQGGTVASYWDGTQFVSNEIVTNRAVLANHVVETSGAGTVFRAK